MLATAGRGWTGRGCAPSGRRAGLFSAWARRRVPAPVAGRGGRARRCSALLMLPALSLHLGEPGSTAQATSGPAHEALAHADPRRRARRACSRRPRCWSTPARPAPVAAARSRAAAATCPARAAALGPGDRGTTGAAGTAIVTVHPGVESSAPAGQATMRRLRDRAGGRRACSARAAPALSLIDFDHAVYGNFPLMLVLIAVATFLLLTRAFRSVRAGRSRRCCSTWSRWPPRTAC